MLNFTAGPITLGRYTRVAASKQQPYARTENFEAKVCVCEGFLKKSVNAPKNAKVSFLTASGTGAMDAAVNNFCTTKKNRPLVVNAGRFGDRWNNILNRYKIPHQTLIIKPYGEIPPISGGYSHIFCQHCETSTGHLLDLTPLVDYCSRTGSKLIVDAISSYMCDPIDMREMDISALIVSSGKALGLHPGMAFTILKEQPKCERGYYLNYANSISNDGHLSYTPAVSIIEQLYQNILHSAYSGLIEKTGQRARYFRESLDSIVTHQIEPIQKNISNGMTPIFLINNNAEKIVEMWQSIGVFVMRAYSPWLEQMFRVGHYGAALKMSDLNQLSDLIKNIGTSHNLDSIV